MRTVVVPDLHVPFNDKNHTKALFRFIRKCKPHKLILLGDVMDLHALTVHRQVPSWQDRLEEEVDAGIRFLEKLRKATGPKCEITYIKGNHEDRWDRQVQGRLPALRLVGCRLPVYLELDRLGIRWVEDASRTPVRTQTGQGQKVRFMHGHEIKGSSRTPAGHALKIARLLGENIHIGHTHRMGMLMAPRTTNGRRKEIFAIEGGLLADMKSAALSYAGPAPEWCSSWMVYDSKDNTSPYPKIHKP